MRFVHAAAMMFLVLVLPLRPSFGQEDTPRYSTGNGPNPPRYSTGNGPNPPRYSTGNNPPASATRPEDSSHGSRAYRGHGRSGHSHHGHAYGPRIYGYSVGGRYGVYGYYYSTSPTYFSFRPHVYAPAYPYYYSPYWYGPVLAAPAVPVPAPVVPSIPVIPRW